MRALVIGMPIVVLARRDVSVIAMSAPAALATVQNAKTVALVWGMRLSEPSAMPWSMPSKR
jgi:hypothetical protein